jgi:hypothetical protein
MAEVRNGSNLPVQSRSREWLESALGRRSWMRQRRSLYPKNSNRSALADWTVVSCPGAVLHELRLRNSQTGAPRHMAFLYVQNDFTLLRPCAAGRDRVLKTFGAALLLAAGLAITAGPALALQVVVTQVDKNTDGSATYHFAVKTDQGETLSPGTSKATLIS